MEVVADFLFWSSKISVDGDCSHEIGLLLLIQESVTNLQCVEKQRHYFPDKGPDKAMTFLVVTCGCESQTVKKRECQRIDPFKLWLWRRLLKVP